MMVLDALRNIATKLESKKIFGIENLLVCFPPDLTLLILGMRAVNFAHG
jgi:hypothetical protein